MTLTERVQSFSLPEVPATRQEALRILEQHEYGVMPPAVQATGAVLSEAVAYAGKAIEQQVEIRFPTPRGEFTLPIHFLCPTKGDKIPAFVFLNFRPDVPDRYYPAEEIIDRGFAVARIYYNDVTQDNGDFESGLAALLCDTDRPADGCGKIGLWAYAASRVLDWLLTLPQIDPDRVAVIGHSRLGKTALWCAANDERFYAACSNDSGAGGDAIFRGKDGEHVVNLAKVFPFWFCPRFAEYSNREDEMPFDQHFLLAAIAPRKILLCAAQEDTWADPQAAICNLLTQDDPAFPTPEQLDAPPVRYCGSRLFYSLRAGLHFLSRSDWNFYMDQLS